ncbi:hypothetical protein WDV93_15065, partial [Pantoea ananatis]
LHRSNGVHCLRFVLVRCASVVQGCASTGKQEGQEVRTVNKVIKLYQTKKAGFSPVDTQQGSTLFGWLDSINYRNLSRSREAAGKISCSILPLTSEIALRVSLATA